MFADADHPVSPAKRAPAGPAARLRDAVHALAGGHGEIVRHQQKAWASITFEGARHTFEFRFIGADAIAAGETLIADLPEHDFDIPGQIVADASVTAADQVLLPEQC